MKKRRCLLVVLGVTVLLIACIQTPSVTSPTTGPATDLLDACREGDISACQWAGNRYHYGRNAPVDYQLAEECYRRACTSNPDLGCKGLYDIGFAYLTGKKVAKNAANAKTLFEPSCAQGYGPACTALANQYRKGKGVGPDAAKAKALYIQGCNAKAGSPQGCWKAGDLVRDSDPATARGFYIKGCKWDNAHACYGLGRLYYDGAGVAQDMGRAAEFFSQSCSFSPDNNDLAGCYLIGRLVFDGRGVAQDKVAATKYFRLGCMTRKKNADACYHLAMAYKTGDAGKTDDNAAWNYFRDACDSGHKQGCLEMHRDMCYRLKQPASCEWLKKRGVQ
jgi:TPR repeat protein